MSINLQHYKLLKKAFTLAEVLITLGVIGVVAAVTMPTLIQNYKNQVAETKLQRFYSAINNAIIASEAVNGDRVYWAKTDNYSTLLDKDGNSIALAWFKKYLQPYMKVSEVKTDEYGRVRVFFADGTALYSVGNNLRDWVFITNPKICDIENSDDRGRCFFSFYYVPNVDRTSIEWKCSTGNFEPYTFLWDCQRKSLYTYWHNNSGCSQNGTYCAKLIQLNGWKIPKDYPKKIK